MYLIAEPSETGEPASERALVVRFCARFTGDPDAAEDLAQQTLLEAWRHEQELRDPEARRSWLLSIARNTCLMWGRSRARETARRVHPDFVEGGLDERLMDDVDLEMELERDELAGLLDRALTLLPADTREVLVRRYIEESPQAEVAARLGLTEGAVEARLHRGKLALKRILTNELSRDAISHGLILPVDANWEETRVWCPGCGKRRLMGRLDAEAGELILRCPDCSKYPYENFINSQIGDELRGVRTFKPAVSRVLDCIHDMYRVRPIDAAVTCNGCGTRVPIEQSQEYGIYLKCPTCRWWDRETWHSLTWSLPETRRFWRDHPRMRFLLEREIEVDGGPAIVTGFESVTDGGRLEVVCRRDSLEIIRIESTSGIGE